jgi:G3E family GTPase
VADLVEGGMHPSDKPLTVLAKEEPLRPEDARLGSVERWDSETGSFPELAQGFTHVFVVVDGKANPIDQIERFKGWLPLSGGQLARILCVVDCRLARKHPALTAWFDACIHFSDVVLLTHREGLDNKWVTEFQGRFKKMFLPFLLETVKDGKVKNPALVLAPQARRISHAFDDAPEWLVDGKDVDELDEEDEGEGEEEVEVTEKVDPYFERWVSGRRVKEIPDIGKYLESEPKS